MRASPKKPIEEKGERGIKVKSIWLISLVVVLLVSFIVISCGPVAPADADSDGVPDSTDNCPDTYNPEQVDLDDDGYGVLCDCNDEDDTIYPEALEICDGIDNDCDPASADGSEDSLVGTSCEGPDSDLCEEGVSGCSGGSITCSDTTGDTLEICDDNIDNDCDGAIDEGCSASAMSAIGGASPGSPQVSVTRWGLLPIALWLPGIAGLLMLVSVRVAVWAKGKRSKGPDYI